VRRALALLLLAPLLPLASLSSQRPAAAGTTPPGAGTCPVFPADNVWNTDISKLPVDPHSAQWLASMNAGSTKLHPDFGSSGDPSAPYGIPYTVVTDSHPKVNVSFQYADESDPGPYPFGSDTPIEGGQNASGDRHAIMIDSTTCTLYELYDAQYSSSGSTAGSGAIWNLNSDALRPATWTSADAAGLPIFPGLLRPDEVLAGAVTHAIRFTAVHTDTSFIWPARHQAGERSDPSLPPMGARFRLKASFDISQYSPETQVVLTAMQHYGLILADNGSNWYFQGSASNSWSDQLISELKTVPASAFDAVDESSLMVDPNSGATSGGPAACQPGPLATPPSGVVARIAGASRDDTAIAASQTTYGRAGSASAVVLASDATFPDALAGTPLAVARHAPLLLTTPSGLTPSVSAEIQRVAPRGATVFVLGGDLALSSAVDSQIAALGDTPQRVAGPDRFATAVAIAGLLGDPSTILEATGLDFPDALSAGAAAAKAGAAVVLTNGSAQAAATTTYLGAHAGDRRYAIGGPAASADTTATAISGTDRFDTAVRVAAQFFPSGAGTLGFASGVTFPDALGGGASTAASHGPLLLVPACGTLPATLTTYLSGLNGAATGGSLYGGTGAVGDDVLAALDQQV